MGKNGCIVLSQIMLNLNPLAYFLSIKGTTSQFPLTLLMRFENACL